MPLSGTLTSMSTRLRPAGPTTKSAMGGREADAATAITCRSGRDEASGDGRRGATGGAGGRALEVPRVAGNAVEFGGGVGDEAELRGCGLAHEDSAGRAETGN